MTKRQKANLIVEVIDEKASMIPGYLWPRTIDAVMEALTKIELEEEEESED